MRPRDASHVIHKLAGSLLAAFIPGSQLVFHVFQAMRLLIRYACFCLSYKSRGYWNSEGREGHEGKGCSCAGPG